MEKLLLVAGGSAAGGLSRYLLAGTIQRIFGDAFPVGTLTVNILGCLAAGMLAAFLQTPGTMREELRLLAAVGFLGGFTTFSAYATDVSAVARCGAWGAALMNVVLSNLLSVGAAAMGFWVCRKLLG